tara:strand:+ start:969 stop:1493 length:525 start_codon:yes stop_codon:yes gene_type:complete
MEDKLKYPIGKFEWVEEPSPKQLDNAIRILVKFPKKLRKKVIGLNSSDLKNKYRPGGWNIAQIIHHLADSHMHCFLRMKHAVLEDLPSIKDYSEKKWASLSDATNTDISYSLDLIEALHIRWTFFLKKLSNKEFKRCYFHSERNKNYPIGTTTLLYAWHCDHHLAHIEISLKKS